MFKMSWALINDGAGQWTGSDFHAAARELSLGVNSVCTAEVDEEVRAAWCRKWVEPLQLRLTREGQAAIAAGEEWIDGAGPILVRLTPRAGPPEHPSVQPE
ncbi:hypothetical protein G3I40_15465 [Streptomyces sp. SID14478]|uniref:hypothetical protein n=1 Tax=Streptomyces sp. SID14478 TaxID=2706073 RepID=UPI0013DB638C|nr:hypothetical protein [Streptomyces sp. SID14478]NEB76609.1 hypothetical protein [Streptomyces sp. SID14478]